MHNTFIFVSKGVSRFSFQVLRFVLRFVSCLLLKYVTNVKNVLRYTCRHLYWNPVADRSLPWIVCSWFKCGFFFSYKKRIACRNISIMYYPVPFVLYMIFYLFIFEFSKIGNPGKYFQLSVLLIAFTSRQTGNTYRY